MAKIIIRFFIFCSHIGLGFMLDKENRNYFDEILDSLNAPYYLEKGQRWLLSQRNKNWGWGSESDTANAIMALQISQWPWFNSSLEYELSVKQLETQFLIDLLIDANSTCKNQSEYFISPGRLAQFINAFLSIDNDPRNFYGYDLISWLQQRQPRYNFEYSYCALALCNAGVKLTEEQVTQMEVIMKKDNGYIPDTKAITLMALTCAVEQNLLKPVDLILYIKQLSLIQRKDGSFGNVWSSAILIQALMPYPYQDYGWNVKLAVEDLLSRQDTDGSFGNQLAAFFVLPILAGRNLLTINKAFFFQEETAEVDETSRINIIYSVWINAPVRTKYSITMMVANGTNLLTVMQKAASSNRKFRFKSTGTSAGHYITSIGGYDQNPFNHTYWTYGFISHQDPDRIMETEKAVDHFIFNRRGQHVVFWYRPVY